MSKIGQWVLEELERRGNTVITPDDLELGMSGTCELVALIDDELEQNMLRDSKQRGPSGKGLLNHEIPF